MGIFDFLSTRNKNTASVAKDRLRILIQQERSMRGAPDYLPMLQRELLEVIRKYVNVDVDAVKVRSSMTLFALARPEEPAFAAVRRRFSMRTRGRSSPGCRSVGRP